MVRLKPIQHPRPLTHRCGPGALLVTTTRDVKEWEQHIDDHSTEHFPLTPKIANVEVSQRVTNNRTCTDVRFVLLGDEETSQIQNTERRATLS